MFDFSDEQEEGHLSAEQSVQEEASKEDEEENKDLENGENRMVTIVVTIEQELLRIMDASIQPDLVAEGNTREEEEEVEGVNLVTTNMMPGFKANSNAADSFLTG